MAKARNINKICLHCFGTLGDDGVCLACGKPDIPAKITGHRLPPHTLLRKQYLIVRALGEGGFGITYLAWDIKKETRVAIKEYYPGNFVTRDLKTLNMVVNKRHQFASLSQGLERFIDEAKTLARFSGLKGIVSVFDFFPAHNTAYLVMEYLDGLSLKRYAQRKGRMSADTVLTILKPVVMSLKEVHKLGLIHRDISPDNIIITRGNEVKLIDFGAAKQTSADQKNLSIVLKQGFAPEEQYRRHGEQGPWTDIYALAVTVYYCITGQLPPESVQRLYEDTLIPPIELGADINEAQQKSLLKALAVHKEDRYQSLDELIEELYASSKPTRAPDADKPAPIAEAEALPVFDFDDIAPTAMFTPYAAPLPTANTPPPLLGSNTPAMNEAYYENLTVAAPAPRLDEINPLVYYQHVTKELALDTEPDEIALPGPGERFRTALKAKLGAFFKTIGKAFKAIGKAFVTAAKAIKKVTVVVCRSIAKFFKFIFKKIHGAGKAITRGTRYIYYKFADEPDDDHIDLDDEN